VAEHVEVLVESDRRFLVRTEVVFAEVHLEGTAADLLDGSLSRIGSISKAARTRRQRSYKAY
jgi:hypothetical protein